MRDARATGSSRLSNDVAARSESTASSRFPDRLVEDVINDLTTLASRCLRVPVVLLSFEEETRQRLAGRFGHDPIEIPELAWFCTHVAEAQRPLVISDIAADEQFRDTRLAIHDSPFRSYAGVPLATVEGRVLGAFCVFDHVPRGFCEAELDTLTIIGRQLVEQLALRRQLALVTDYRELFEDSNVLRRVFFDCAVDGIVTIHEDGFIARTNEAFKRMLGYEGAALQGRDVCTIVHEDHRDACRKALESARETDDAPREERQAPEELLLLRDDGSTLPVEATVGKAQLRGRWLYHAVVRDLTERKHIEGLKADFVATVSHELRTPLTSIRGALGLLASGSVPRDSDDAGEIIDIALHNSERVVRLINEMLDIERIEAGELELHLETVSLPEAIQESVDANYGFATDHNAKIAVLGELPELEVFADPDRLAQIFANLLSNAIKFSPENETVTVGLELVEDRARVIVEDRGPGVPPSFVPHLFSRFAQADTAHNRRSTGTGLGLSISKVLVEAMDGTIYYDPREPVGSRFCFELPIASSRETGVYTRRGKKTLPIYGGELCVDRSSDVG